MEEITTQMVQLVKWGVYIWGAKTLIEIVLRELKKK